MGRMNSLYNDIIKLDTFTNTTKFLPICFRIEQSMVTFIGKVVVDTGSRTYGPMQLKINYPKIIKFHMTREVHIPHGLV